MRFTGVLLVPVGSDLGGAVGWSDGPVPLELPFGGVTDRRTRGTYFDRRAASVLYGEREGSTRAHRSGGGTGVGPLTVTALEWLTASELGAGVAGVLVIHLVGESDDLVELHDAWSSCVRWKAGASGREVLRDLLAAELETEVAPSELARPFGLAYVDQLPDAGAEPFPTSQLPIEDQWSFAFAAGVAEPQYGLSSTEVATLPAQRFGLSADWSALVLRDGAAFVGHTPGGEGPSEFLETAAATYVRTVYADAFLLGTLQTTALAALTDALAAMDDPARSPREVERLDARFSRFRNTLWWQHLTQHGHGNDLLRLLHEQRRLPQLVEQTTAELEDYSRQTTLRLGRNLNVIVALFALIGAVGVAIDIYLVFIDVRARPGPVTIVVAALVLAVLTALVVAYPLGWLTRQRPRSRSSR